MLVCVLCQKYEVWETLLKSTKVGNTLLNTREILDTALLICATDWKQGLKPLVSLLESAFCKSPISQRVLFISQVLKIKSDCFKDVVRIDKLLTFAEWMYEHYKQQE